MKKVNNKYIFLLGLILGLIFSITSVYAIEAYIESSKVSYDNKHTEKDNVQDSIDELYERSGIHKEKWVDPILNGADPVLKAPLIPVEIKNDGSVYYANQNSEWYNYSEKRWAYAVILNDNINHNVGDKIDDKDIKGYFVWIPRYQYKVWDLGKYTTVMALENLTDDKATAAAETSLWRVAGKNTRIIDVKFGTADDIPKMAEPTKTEVYYTHPAFTLGNKNLNGIWVGKFETGGTSEDTMVVKPNVISWRNQTVKEFFTAGKNFAAELDSHMMKNIEWGVAAYLSHSQYGIGNEVNINNAKDYMTGYSVAPNISQSVMPSESGTSDDDTKTQPWNTPIGHLASTTGNITGIYDMGGGSWEYVSAYRKDTLGSSTFSQDEINIQVKAGYIDEYPSNSEEKLWNNRILGDATGEMGPFYNYFEGNGVNYIHSSWYGENVSFIDSTQPWFRRGGFWDGMSIAGQFTFNKISGGPYAFVSFRLALATS